MTLQSILQEAVRDIDKDLAERTKDLWATIKAKPPDKRRELLWAAVRIIHGGGHPMATAGSLVLINAYFRCDGDLSKMDDAIDIEVQETMSKVSKMIREAFT